MKKERSNISVICTILFLSLFIVLPPMFRTLMPKEELVVSENRDTLELLICKHEKVSEIITTSVNTTYSNAVINKIVFDFKKYEPDPSALAEDGPYSPTELIQAFSTIDIVNNVTEPGSVVVTIDKDVVATADTRLEEYIKDIDTQKAYYEALGFTCNIMKS